MNPDDDATDADQLDMTPPAPYHPATAELLRFFQSEHLPDALRVIAEPFGKLAHAMVGERRLGGAEATVGLRKLLEAKDCFVRAALPRRP